MAHVVNQALAEIDGADLRVAPDFLGRALGDQCAAIENQDAIGMLETTSMSCSVKRTPIA
jgi:hypothetical protein